MNLDHITLSFESKSSPWLRYHVCAANGNNWTSMRSFKSLRGARAAAGRKQERDPLRDVRLLDRVEGEQLSF